MVCQQQQKHCCSLRLGDSLSGWWLLWNKINPFSQRVKVISLPSTLTHTLREKVPNMSDLQDHLSYVACEAKLNEVFVDLDTVGYVMLHRSEINPTACICDLLWKSMSLFKSHHFAENIT